MTAVEITFMCLVVFAPLLVWFVVLLVRNKDLPRNNMNEDNNEAEQARWDRIHNPFYKDLPGNVFYKNNE